MEEKVFFESENNKVTNARFITYGQTYALAGLTSVQMTKIPPRRFLSIFLGFISAWMGAAGINGGDTTIGTVLLIIGALLFLNAFRMKPTYSVVTVSAGGAIQALSSKDFNLISNIVNAINDAIVHRG